jgi:hypothetical protein
VLGALADDGGKALPLKARGKFPYGRFAVPGFRINTMAPQLLLAAATADKILRRSFTPPDSTPELTSTA